MAEHLGDVEVRIHANTKPLKDGLDDAERAAETGGTKTGASFARSLSLAMAGVGAIVVGAVGAGMAEAVSRAADFEQTMANVNAITMADAEGLEKLTEAALQLGSTTKFTADEAGEALQFLGMAGFDVEESIEALPGVARLAAAANMDMGDAADIVSNVMGGFGATAEDTGHYVDVFAAISSRANTDVYELGEAMKYAGPVAAGLGLSMEDVGAAVAFMADNGIKGSEAGTAMRSSFLNMAAPGGQAMDALKDVGLMAYDSNAALRHLAENGVDVTNIALEDAEKAMAEYAIASGLSIDKQHEFVDSFRTSTKFVDQETGQLKDLAEMADIWAEATEGMTDVQKTDLAARIAGREAASGFISMMSAGGPEIAEFSQGLADAGGIAEEMADRQLNTLQGQLTLLGSAIDGAFIKVGNVILPILTRFVREGLIPAVNAVSAWIDTLMAAGGPIDTLREWIRGMIAVVVDLFNGEGSDALTGWADTIAVVKDIVASYMDAMRTIIMTIIGAVAEFWEENGDDILAWTMETWDTIKNIIGLAMDLIRAVVVPIWTFVADFISNNQGTIVTILTTAWNSIKLIINTVLAVIEGIIKTVLKAVEGDWEGAWDEMKAIGGILLDAIIELVVNSFNGMKDTLFGVLDSIYDGFSESFDDMVAYVFGLITRAKEAGAAFIGGIRDGVNGAIGGLKDSVRNGVAGLVDMLPGSEPKDGSSPLAGLAERGRAIIDNMIPGLQQGLGDMSGVMAGGLGGLADGMQVGNSVNVAINNPMVDSAARINEMRDTIVEAAREAIGSDLARSVDGLILGGGAR